MRLTKLLLVGVSLSFISGCTDYVGMQEGVIKNNQRVETSLTSYEASKTVGKDLEPLIIQSIYESNPSLLDGALPLNENQEAFEGVKQSINKLSLYISSYIEEANDSGEEYRYVSDVPEFVKSKMEVYYFLDDETGQVEQMFLIQLPNGYIGELSIIWVGGVAVDFKTFGIN